MRNYFLIALAGFVIWSAATGRLVKWFDLARVKMGVGEAG